MIHISKTMPLLLHYPTVYKVQVNIQCHCKRYSNFLPIFEENVPHFLENKNAGILFLLNFSNGAFFLLCSFMNLGNYSLQQRNIMIFSLLVLLGATIFFGLGSIVQGLLGAVIIYVIFRPFNIYLQESRHWKPALAAILIMFTSFICLVLPFFFLIKMITDRIGYYNDHPEQIEALFQNINAFAASRLNEPHLINDLGNKLKEGAGELIANAVNKAVFIFIQVVVMYFTLFFTIRDFRAFERGIMKYVPFKKSHSKRIGHEIRNLTYSNILGQGFIAIVQGTLVGIGFLIFGIPEPLFWGVVSGFLSMIPMFGSPLIFMPAGIIEISNGNYVSGIGIILYGYILVTTIDNVIRMILGKKIANTHPLITIIGVVIGLPLFGILGILYGPLMLTSFLILLEIFDQNKTELAKIAELESEENGNN